MAHHLADLIQQARTLKGDKQQQAQTAAADLILKLWSKRENLPGRVYPLKGWGRALSVLGLLETEASPFNRVSIREIDLLLVKTFDQLRKIVAHGIILTLDPPAELQDDDAAAPFIDDEEKRFLAAMNCWAQHFKRARRSRYPDIVVTTKATDEPESTIEPNQLTEEDASKRALVAEIDDLLATLAKLKILLGKV